MLSLANLMLITKLSRVQCRADIFRQSGYWNTKDKNTEAGMRTRVVLTLQDGHIVLQRFEEK